MKKIFAILLTIILTMTGISVIGYAAETKAIDTDLKKAYISFLKDMEKNLKSEDTQSFTFAIYDLTKDGIPELLVHNSLVENVTIYGYAQGNFSEFVKLTGDIGGLYELKNMPGLLWNVFKSEKGFSSNTYNFIDGNLKQQLNVGMIKVNLDSNSGWKSDEFFYNNKPVTSDELSYDLNILCQISEKPLTDDNIQTSIQNYIAFDQSVKARPDIAAWDTGRMDHNYIGYANGIGINSLSDEKGIMPLVMVNGNFVDKTGIIIRNGSTYASADFLKYNFESYGVPGSDIEKIDIDGTTYWKLRPFAEKLGMKIQYFDNLRRATEGGRGISIITIEAGLPENLILYSQQQALDIVKKAYDTTYSTVYPIFSEEERGENLQVTGMLGRYYLIRNAGDSLGYFILINPYTGEIFEDSTFATASFRINEGLGQQFMVHDGIVKETNDKIVWEDTEFSLQFPIEWKDKFSINQQFNDLGTWPLYKTAEIVNGVNKNSGHGGVLFTIGRFQTESLNDLKTRYLENVKYEVIGTVDGYTYIYYKPADIQYNSKDDVSKNEYMQMAKDVSNIQEIFSLSQ